MSTGEIALTALLLAIVLIAPKVGRIGEKIGGLFEPTEPPKPPRRDD